MSACNKLFLYENNGTDKGTKDTNGKSGCKRNIGTNKDQRE